MQPDQSINDSVVVVVVDIFIYSLIHSICCDKQFVYAVQHHEWPIRTAERAISPDCDSSHLFLDEFK